MHNNSHSVVRFILYFVLFSSLLFSSLQSAKNGSSNNNNNNNSDNNIRENTKKWNKKRNERNISKRKDVPTLKIKKRNARTNTYIRREIAIKKADLVIHTKRMLYYSFFILSYTYNTHTNLCTQKKTKNKKK